jgi:glycine hydroxymethyltransferase
MTAPTETFATAEALAQTDPDVLRMIQAEHTRQQTTLEMIASENHTSPAVMAAVGSCLTNKYCEGYPGKRYYSGTGIYDEVEQLAIERAKKLFGCEFANVQPHSGANANLAVFAALLQPGDTYMSVVLSDGGHLTHGSPVNVSGKWFHPVHYPLVYDESREDYGHIDYGAVEKLAAEHKPKLIMCGYSAYPRVIDFARFRAIADSCGAMLMADIAHIAGLVAAGVHPSPFPHCHVVTTTTHKTLRGPRGGLILTDDADLAKQLDKAVFPGTQGGPLMHVIAGKAVCFGEALQPAFRDYAQRVIDNAKALATALMEQGFHLTSRGTDNHLMLIDLRRTDESITGREAATWLESAGIVANMNTVPHDDRSPMKTSGLRLGTPALTTRGMGAAEMKQIAEMIHRVIVSKGDEATCDSVRQQAAAMCEQFPMP